MGWRYEGVFASRRVRGGNIYICFTHTEAERLKPFLIDRLATHGKCSESERGQARWGECQWPITDHSMATGSSVPKLALLSVPTKALSMSFISLIVKPLAYLGLPSYLLHRLSKSSPLTRFYICNFLYLCSISFCSSLGFLSAIPLSLMGRRYDVNYVVARSFYAIFNRLSGLRIVVEGEEHLQTRPCILIGNHQSMIDVFCLGRCVASPIHLLHGLIDGQHVPNGNPNNGQKVTQIYTTLWSIPAGRRRSVYRSRQQCGRRAVTSSCRRRTEEASHLDLGFP